MDSKNVVYKDKYERIQAGSLKILKKNFPLYKGLNTVGRNIEAIVNLKNINVSKNHAAIVIVDEVQHYICDMKSSNGTSLIGSKLVPFKLYELSQDSEISFGALTGYYTKVNYDATTHLEAENMEMSQNETQSFYEGNTQLMYSYNVTRNNENKTIPPLEPIHDYASCSNNRNLPNPLRPQIVEIPKDNNMHELPTQVDSPEQAVSEETVECSSVSQSTVDFHEAETQIVDNLRDRDKATPSEINQSIHEMETQRNVVEEHLESASIDQSEIDFHEAETQVLPARTAKTPAKTSDYDIHEAATQVVTFESTLNKPESRESNIKPVTDPLLTNIQPKVDVIDRVDKTVDDRGELVDENSNESIDFLTMQNNVAPDGVELNTNLDSSTDLPPLVLETSNKGVLAENSDDSDTEDIICHPRKGIRQTIDSSDSETDIDEDVLKNINSKDNSILPGKSLCDTLNNTADVIPATQDEYEAASSKYKMKVINQIDEKVLESSEESFRLGLTELMNEATPQNSESTTSAKSKSSSAGSQDVNKNTEDILIPPAEFNDIASSSVKKCDNISTEKSNENGDNEIVLKTDKKFNFKKKNCTVADTSLTKILTTDNQVASKLSPIRDHEVTKSGGNSEQEKSKNDEEDDIYCQQTQKLDIEQIANLPFEKVNENINLYEAATQIMPNLNSEDAEANNINNEDEIYLQPTQQLLIDQSNFKTPNRNSSFVKSRKSINTDIYELATQKLEVTATSDKTSEDNKDDDIYCQPTQKFVFDESTSFKTPNRCNVSLESKDDIYLQPTQKIVLDTSTSFKTPHKCDTSKDDIYLQPTQKLDYDNGGESPEHDGDDFYLQPTQAMNMSCLKTNKNSPSAREPNDSERIDLYDYPTQKVNFDNYLQESAKSSTETVTNKPIEIDIYDQQTQKMDFGNYSCKQNSNSETVESSISSIQGKASTSYIQNDACLPNVNKPDAPIDIVDSPLEVQFDTENIKLNSDIPERPGNPVKNILDNKLSQTSVGTSIFGVEGTDNELPQSKLTSLQENDESLPDEYHLANTQPIDEVLVPPTPQLKENLRAPKIKGKKTTPLEHEPQKASTSRKKPIKEFDDEENEKGDLKKGEDAVKHKTVDKQSMKIPLQNGIQNDEYVVVNEDATIEQNDTVNKGNSTFCEEVKSDIDQSFALLEAKTTKTRKIQKTKTDAVCDIKVPLPKTRKNTKTGKNTEPLPSSSTKRTSGRDKKSRALSYNDKLEKEKEGEEEIAKKARKDLDYSSDTNSFPGTIPSKVIGRGTRTKGKIILSDSEESQASVTSDILNDKEHDAKTFKDQLKNTSNKDILKANNTADTPTDSDVTRVGRTKPASRKIVSSDSEDSELDIKRAKVNQSKVVARRETGGKPARGKRRTTARSAIKMTSSDSEDSKSVELLKESIKDKSNEVIKPPIRKRRQSRSSTKIPTSDSENTEGPVRIRKLQKIEEEAKASTSRHVLKSGTDDDSESNKSASQSSRTTLHSDQTHSRISKNTKISKVKEEQAKTPTGRKKLKRSAEDESERSRSSSSTPSKVPRMDISVMSSPDRQKRKLKPKVVFTMMDDPALESCIRQLGGMVVDSVEACTILVTQAVKRSQKLLSAVGQGKPICSPTWIRESKKAGKFLDPWDFILQDKEAEKKWSFSLKESLNRSQNRNLLENYTICLCVNQAADVLKGAVESAGGKCLTRIPSANSIPDNFVIVSTPENKNKYSKILKQKAAIKVVEPEAIFDGVLRQELRLTKHLIA